MTADAKAALEAFHPRCGHRLSEAFDFRIENGRIVSFTDRMILLRADKG